MQPEKVSKNYSDNGLLDSKIYYYYYCPFNVRVSPSTGVGLIRRHVDGLIAFLHSILFTTLLSLRLREDKSCLMLSSHLFFGRPRG